MIKDLQASLRDSFHMKDLGPLNYFLGLEVDQNLTNLFINNQHKYTLDLIELLNLEKPTPLDTLPKVNLKIGKVTRPTHVPAIGGKFGLSHNYKTKHLICCQSRESVHNYSSTPSSCSCKTDYPILNKHYSGYILK